jgi:hypothetical protein
MRRQIIEFSNLKEFLIELYRFHGQDVYAGLGPAIAKKKPYFGIILALVKIFCSVRVVNYFLLVGILLGYRIFRYPSEGNRVFEYGLSRNNEASFERLNRCLAEHGVHDVSINEKRLALWIRLKVVLGFSSIWRAAGVLSENLHTRPLVHMQAIIGFASLLLYYRYPLPESVKVVCVASDHSPVSQALLFIARLEGRRTCYIQHAPITDYFPPLTHDLAILYDQASAEAYERAATRHGILGCSTVVLFSPFRDEFRRPWLDSERHVVGMCLSFLPNLTVIKEILRELSRSFYVSSILIRPHPRCQLDLSDILSIDRVGCQANGQSAFEFFDDVDIVLVPNSGVTIEALHSGRPTFFIPDADQLPNDYYGFVFGGIVPIFRIDALASPDRLMSFFDDSWIKRFSYYDETVNSSQAAACSQVAVNFKILLS